MKDIILMLAKIVNLIHDLLIKLSKLAGLHLTDKELHFWVIGIIGIVSFLFVDFFFHLMAKWSITALSFIYTFSLVFIFVFAVEIQQKITGRGNMEFNDAAIGIIGFLAFFLCFILFKGIYLFIRNK